MCRYPQVEFGDQYASAGLPPVEDSRNAPPDSLGVMDNLLFVTLKDKGVDGLQQPDNRDLTRMLTSIVAPRVVYTGPSVSSNLGLDPCFSQADLDAERLRVLDKVYAQLPNQRECKVSVDRYLTQFDWFFSILHHATWWAEYERFWEMYEQGRKYEVDPAWLAVLFLVRIFPPASPRPQLSHQCLGLPCRFSRSPLTSRCTWPLRVRRTRRRIGRTRVRGITPAPKN